MEHLWYRLWYLLAIELNLFLTMCYVLLPPIAFDIFAHLVPISLANLNKWRSSSMVHLLWLTAGLRWLNHIYLQLWADLKKFLFDLQYKLYEMSLHFPLNFYYLNRKKGTSSRWGRALFPLPTTLLSWLWAAAVDRVSYILWRWAFFSWKYSR